MECSTLSLYQDCQRILSAGNYEKHREYFKKLVSVFSFEEFAARNCDQMIAVNQPDAAFIEHLFDKNALVVPTGVSLDFVQESSTVRQVPENQFNVGFLGYYWHYPNVDGVLWYLNRIHPYVKDLVPNYQFKIYGRGPIEKYLGAFSRDPQIEVVGEVDSIPEAFEAVDVAVAPLINGAGIRGKVNQYVAMKKAVVGTPLSMAGLPYQNMRDVFVESSPYSFAERIVELLENSEKRKQLANSAFDQMERYVQCDSTLKPIQDLIERP